MSFRFIVVDDAPFLQELIKNIAIEAGGECVGLVGKGTEVNKSVQYTLPDLVFLDMVLPQKNGVDVLKELNEFFPTVKVIVISSLERDFIEKKLLGCSVDAIILKPFTKVELKQAISRVMADSKEVKFG
ncbi:MAG: response regulator [Bdellovibrionota bacterium]